MKVSTQIVAGYALLLLLMLGALGYEVLLVGRMHEISEALSASNFRVSLTGIRLHQHLRDAEEFAIKYLVAGDERYRIEFDSSRLRFERVLAEMEDLAGSEAGTLGLGQLRAAWQDLLEVLDAAARTRAPGSYSSYTALPTWIEDQLQALYGRLDTVYTATEASVDRDLARSAELSRRAERISWITLAIALLMGGAVVFPIVGSISNGLKRLTEGTRRLAAGELSHRIHGNRGDEFGELARSFNGMAVRLEELDHLKKDFVSSVSHELKSPIAACREIVQLLLDEVPGPLNDEQKRLLNLSVRSSRRLSSMVADLLDLARMDAGTIRYRMRRSNLTVLVRATLEEFDAVLAERGLAVALQGEIPDECIVDCDCDRMTQAIGNVIDNAMKFSTRGGTIGVRIETLDAFDRNREAALLSVWDTGPGIPDRYKETIFARFQQVPGESAHRSPGGTGLGLAITRGIMEAHSGRIWVEDNPGGGSVFRLALPVASSTRGETEHAEARPAWI